MTNTCNKCACNKVCNHDLFGFENCGNFVPFNDAYRRKEEEKKFLILVFALSRINDGFVWMPDLIRWYSDVFNIPTKRLYYWLEKWDRHEVIEYGTSINGIHFISEFFMKGEYKDLIDTFLSVLKKLSIDYCSYGERKDGNK